ncbi:MAG TPA: oxidoreductase, partial [Pusillimonas sp.]|nr:oxidoreductase [Pusillimonas sp.]
MNKTRTALIVGGGIGGMSAALELNKSGIETHLIDIDPHWKVYGAGITITGPTLRAFKAIGILEEVKAHAYTGNGIQIRNASGEPVSIVPTPPTDDPDVPGCGGIMRPLLHNILAERIKTARIKVDL